MTFRKYHQITTAVEMSEIIEYLIALQRLFVGVTGVNDIDLARDGRDWIVAQIMLKEQNLIIVLEKKS